MVTGSGAPSFEAALLALFFLARSAEVNPGPDDGIRTFCSTSTKLVDSLGGEAELDFRKLLFKSSSELIEVVLDSSLLSLKTFRP